MKNIKITIDGKMYEMPVITMRGYTCYLDYQMKMSDLSLEVLDAQKKINVLKDKTKDGKAGDEDTIQRSIQDFRRENVRIEKEAIINKMRLIYDVFVDGDINSGLTLDDITNKIPRERVLDVAGAIEIAMSNLGSNDGDSKNAEA